MKPETKEKIIANLWSLLRLALNALAGYVMHRPESSAKELGIGILSVTASWTVIDNSGASVTEKVKEIGKGVGLLGLIFLLSTGCASTPQEKIVRFAAVAKSVAFEGAVVWLEEKTQHAATLQKVVDQLDISIQSKQFTPARLVAILKPLNIRELNGKEGRIAVAATIVIWDSLRLAGVIGDTSNLEPVFVGLRDGFKAAIDAVK